MALARASGAFGLGTVGTSLARGACSLLLLMSTTLCFALRFLWLKFSNFSSWELLGGGVYVPRVRSTCGLALPVVLINTYKVLDTLEQFDADDTV